MGDTGAADAVLEAARHGAGTDEIAVTGEPVRLEGGHSADLYRFRLSRGPVDLIDRDLVLRLPRRPGGDCEVVIQGAVAELGFPAPAILRSGRTTASQRYTIMAFAPGKTLFHRAGPWRAFREAPVRLATLMLELHRLDPEPVRDALEAAGVDVVDDATRVLADVERLFSVLDDSASGLLRDWVRKHRPDDGPPVVCHGDLHALNVLVDGERAAVIDWELAALGRRELDVARTKLLLRAVPMELPTAARPVIQRIGHAAAARFETAYIDEAELDAAALRWCEAVHASRMIGMILDARRAGNCSDPVVEAWTPTLRLLTRLVARATGIDLAAGSRRAWIRA